MVVPTILACFLNNMFNFTYFSCKFWIKHLYNTSKIISLFILLSSYSAFISKIIIEGNQSLKLRSTPSQLIFVHPLSFLLYHQLNLATSICLQPHIMTWLQAPPLSWGMWARIQTPQLTSEVRTTGTCPSPFQRDVGSFLDAQFSWCLMEE